MSFSIFEGKWSAGRGTLLLVLVLLQTGWMGQAQATLDPAGEARYGSHTLAAGFTPDPFTLAVVSGGDVAVKALRLGDNCLGFAAADPDVEMMLDGARERITFLIAADDDTTLIINRPDGSWSCNDDTNGLNPALVFFDAAPGAYQIWIGSYAAATYDDATLYVATAGPEALPTTATGPDPGRDALYGEVTLAPGFQPQPFTLQLIGGGRNRAQDFIAAAGCHGHIAEAPDFSIALDQDMAALWIALFSPADLTLVVNAADGSWHCSATNPRIGFDYAWAGLYDIWVGSAELGNYAAGVLSVTEYEPPADFSHPIDASCPGLPATDLQLGARAIITHAGDNPLYIAPETASTRIFMGPLGSGVMLIGGPICKAEHRWWRVEFGDGLRGWMADGDAASRWLEAAA